MARLASLAKAGFYAAAPQAVAAMIRYLRPPESGAGFFILDPCAGEGEAIGQLAAGLGCRAEDVLAVELDEGRAAKLKEHLPDAQAIAPASFFGAFCTSSSVDFCWCNPPYADGEAGTNRIEFDFLQRVTGLLRPRGVLAWVVPEPVIDKWYAQEHLLAHYYGLSAVTFPSKYRRFRELVVFGVKRSKPVDPDALDFDAEVKRFDGDRTPTADFYYRIPSGTGPNTWRKCEPVESELIAAIGRSPLNKLMQSPPEPELASPPMSLTKGHLALLLASGHIDGIVKHPDDQHPHIIRGIATKTPFIQSVHTEEVDGQTITKTVKSERITVIVRALVHTGRIVELTQKGATE